MSRANKTDRPDAPTPPGSDAPPPRAHLTPDTRHLTLLLLTLSTLLTLATLLAYWPVFHNEFIKLDDAKYLTENPHVFTGLTWENIKWAFTSFYAANWHPLTWISHMADCQFFGLRPAWHHGVNLLLHTASSLLLFFFLVRTTAGERRQRTEDRGQRTEDRRQRTEDRGQRTEDRGQRTEDRGQGTEDRGQWSVVSGQWSALWPSFFVAALFALHPLHVESVAWVAERKDVLSTFFFLLTLIVYSKYVAGVEGRESGFRVQGSGSGSPSSSAKATGDKQSKVPSPKPSVASGPSPFRVFRVFRGPLFWYFSALFLFALGLMAKPMLVTLPFVLLLLDLWPLNRVSSVRCQASGAKCQVSSDGPKSKVQSQQPVAPEGRFKVQSSKFKVQGSPQLAFGIWKLAIEKIPFFALSALSSYLTFLSQNQAHAVSTAEGLPFYPRLETALVAYIKYLGKIIWPTNLAAFYPHPGVLGPAGEYPQWLVFTCALVLAAITAVAVHSLFKVQSLRFRVQSPKSKVQSPDSAQVSGSPRHSATEAGQWSVVSGLPFAVGWFWFLGTLVPVIGLVQVGGQELADRYSYIPSIGIFIIVAWTTFEFNAKTQRRKDAEKTEDKSTLSNPCAFASLRLCVKVFLLLGILGVCAVLTHAQTRVWHDNYTLFKHALEVTKNNAVAMYEVAAELEEQHKFDDAEKYFRNAVAADPSIADAYYSLGTILASRGKLDDAIAQYHEAIRWQPWRPSSYNGLGGVYLAQGKLDEAKAQWLEAIRLDPDFYEAHFNLANFLLNRGDLPGAAIHFQEAHRIRPSDIAALSRLATVQNLQGKPAEAEVSLRALLAIEQSRDREGASGGKGSGFRVQESKASSSISDAPHLTPDTRHMTLLLALGRALAAQGKIAEAETQLREAARLGPTNADTQIALGSVLMIAAKTNEAATCFAEARRLDPGLAARSLQEGKALVEKGDLTPAKACLVTAVSLEPDNPAPHSALGQLLLRQGKFDEAISELERAVSLFHEGSGFRVQVAATSSSNSSSSTPGPRPSFGGPSHLTPDTRHLTPSGSSSNIPTIQQSNNPSPALTTLYYNLATAHLLRGHFSQAITNYHRALEIDPDSTSALNDLAWLLATAAQSEFRDGPEAVRLAERACRLSGGKEARFWGTLDAAYAEAGRWDDAIATAEKTKGLALKSGDQTLASLADERLALYRKHQPFRQ